MEPIGASTTWRWHGYDNSWIDLDGRRVQSVSGGGHWGGGMFINAWDMARFGYLFLRNGTWKGREIVTPKWIAMARTPGKVNADVRVHELVSEYRQEVSAIDAGVERDLPRQRPEHRLRGLGERPRRRRALDRRRQGPRRIPRARASRRSGTEPCPYEKSTRPLFHGLLPRPSSSPVWRPSCPLVDRAPIRRREPARTTCTTTTFRRRRARTPWAPSWSPDGKSVAVAMSGSIWKVDPATGVAHELTYGPTYHSSPDWSPDGRWIIYTADNNSKTIQLEILNVETGESKPLTTDASIYTDPVFSPDGDRVAYVSTKPNGYFNVYIRAIKDGQWAGDEIAVTTDNKFPERSALLRHRGPAHHARVDAGRQGAAARLQPRRRARIRATCCACRRRPAAWHRRGPCSSSRRSIARGRTCRATASGSCTRRRVARPTSSRTSTCSRRSAASPTS